MHGSLEARVAADGQVYCQHCELARLAPPRGLRALLRRLWLAIRDFALGPPVTVADMGPYDGAPVEVLVRVLLADTAFWSGGFQRHPLFDAIVNRGDGAIPALRDALFDAVTGDGLGSWALLQLLGRVLGPGRRPRLPDSDRGRWEPVSAAYLDAALRALQAAR